MGLFDIFGPSQEELNAQYARGVDDSKNAGLVDGFVHELGDIVGCILPFESQEHKAYEAGYHDQFRGEAYKK